MGNLPLLLGGDFQLGLGIVRGSLAQGFQNEMRGFSGGAKYKRKLKPLQISAL